MRPIPFNRPPMLETAYQYLRQAVANNHLSGDGPFTQKCHATIQRLFGVPKVLLTTSCTHALEMAALLLDIKQGDEVIVPSFTFVSTVNAFVLRGATPIFADIRPDTLNLDENRLAGLLTPRTKAIVPVHYAGVGCEMDAICQIAKQANVAVVEDNAHGLFGKYRGRFLGTFGCLATQSFHETKNLSCGEGGALLLNDARLTERAEIIREKGTNRNRFFRGQVDKYTWVDLGSSYLPSDVLAALLYSQLELWETIQARRQQVWGRYRTELADWADAEGVFMPQIPEHCEQPAHLFYLLLPSLELRQAFIAHMKAAGIISVFHYLPLHLSQMGRTFGGQEGQCPVTEMISDRLVRLPLFFDLSEADQDRILSAVRSFRVQRRLTVQPKSDLKQAG